MWLSSTKATNSEPGMPAYIPAYPAASNEAISRALVVPLSLVPRDAFAPPGDLSLYGGRA